MNVCVAFNCKFNAWFLNSKYIALYFIHSSLFCFSILVSMKRTLSEKLGDLFKVTQMEPGIRTQICSAESLALDHAATLRDRGPSSPSQCSVALSPPPSSSLTLFPILLPPAFG